MTGQTSEESQKYFLEESLEKFSFKFEEESLLEDSQEEFLNSCRIFWSDSYKILGRNFNTNSGGIPDEIPRGMSVEISVGIFRGIIKRIPADFFARI